MLALIAGIPFVGRYLKAGLRFLVTPVGQALVVAALIGGSYLYGHHRGESAAGDLCEAQKQASIEAARQIDAKAAVEARATMEKQTREALARVSEMQGKVDEYAKVAESCSMGDADVEFLNGLGGMPGDGAPGAIPIPPARR